MKFNVLLTFLMIPLIGLSQERGAGIRFGEPFSLTYKDFIEDYFSFELMLGSGGVNSSNYYKRSFDKNPPTSDAVLMTYSVNRGASINGRLALHEDITDRFEITEGSLLAYAGVGVQLRTTHVTYAYLREKVNPNPGAAILLMDERSNVDGGPEAFAGAEFYFDKIPISVFAETGIFLELIDRVNFRGLGGVGVRYLF